MEKKKSPLRSIAIALAVLVGLVIYAYGFQVTQVSLEETSDPLRQERFIRILRALARPDLVTYDKDEFVVETPIHVPCVDTDGVEPPAVDTSKPYLVVTPECADPQSIVTVEGFNFEPNTNGPLNFIPPSGVSLKMSTIQTDARGHFKIETKLPKRPSEEVQTIRAVTRRSVGSPHLSANALQTWDKIVETVFLALLATTFGVIFAVPLSFLAAKNIMAPISSPVTSVALSIILLPLGLVLGREVGIRIGQLSQFFTNNVIVNLLAVLLIPVLLWFAVRWALPPVEETRPTPGTRLSRIVVIAISGLLAILFLFLIANLAAVAGRSIGRSLGSFGFLGTFLANLGDILGFSVILISSLVGISIFNMLAGKVGLFIFERTSPAVNRIINLVLGTVAGAVLFALIGAAINWLYQINIPLYTFIIPAILGAVVGFITATVLSRNAVLPIGLTIYTIMRTIFNGLRSIESLVMVIVFSVWVGIGPFAGVLALALHTIVSNAKLYSEQVESIMAGPIEAITATGANRLQTIIYAVIPQIIPPFISYTMYRWDINVRMSTIIGFAGGGGIGFLLQQNINLLNYRQASAQMLAIAIVVASMDYMSSILREKYV